MKENLPQRKPTRLKQHDYDNGIYFVTICTHDRNCILSKILGAIHSSPDMPEICTLYDKRNEHTDYGNIVDEIIKSLPQRFSVYIPEYVIMPNHVHIIVIINEKRAIRESPLQNKERSYLSKVIGYLKMNASRKIHLTYAEKVWQRGYHDHIIRDEKDYEKISKYIQENIMQWDKDCFYVADI